jgi:hypothetical protein
MDFFHYESCVPMAFWPTPFNDSFMGHKTTKSKGVWDIYRNIEKEGEWGISLTNLPQ